ncbi:hypothetical protein K1X84_05440 [bacterium]|nr:hypothetical protein [bacterium]
MNNKIKISLTLALLALIILTSACQKSEPPSQSSKQTVSKEFADYWYQGKAELNRYEIEQARYGEIRKGDVVLIFVTEDFNSAKQVKLENYSDEAKSKAIPLLKMNYVVKFNTGIYPYSVMTSVFTPVDLSKTLKISNSVQEWCGHTYTQLNLKDNQYVYEGHSYFENEADASYKIGAELLEDEIWTRIRLNPQSLPLGKIKIIPGLIQARFLHRPTATETATAVIIENPSDSLMTYSIQYESYQRDLNITFKKSFPHEIISFEGTYIDGFGPKAKLLKTKAVRTHHRMLDYWTKNSEKDSTYRFELGLK